MNEFELREALRRVTPVDVDEVMIATAIRHARARRRRLIAGVVGIVLVLGLVGGVAVWRSTTQTVAVPDPRASTVPTVTTTPTASTTPMTSAPSTPSSSPPSTPAATQATYRGSLGELPASYGTATVTMPDATSKDWVPDKVPVWICVPPGKNPEPTPVTTLKALVAARSMHRAGDVNIAFQSSLEFADAVTAQAFVAELQRLKDTCPIRQPVSLDKPGAQALSRPLPAAARAAVDDGLVVGYTSLLPGGPGTEGYAYYVGRSGRFVAVVGYGLSGPLAGTVNADADKAAGVTLAAIARQSATTYAGATTVFPAEFRTVRVVVTADGPAGKQTGYVRMDAPVRICGLTSSNLATLRRATAAATVVRAQGQPYDAQSVLEFGTAAEATAFIQELRDVLKGCPTGEFVPATRAIPQPVTTMADEGVVVGAYAPSGQQDGVAVYAARKGKVVVVTMTWRPGDLARTPQSEIDHMMTGPILDVLSQS